MISFIISVVPPKRHRTSCGCWEPARALAVVIQHELLVKCSSCRYLGATPFTSCPHGERYCDEEQDQDDQPFCRSIAAVRIDPEYGLYPVMPEERNDGDDPGDRAEYGFQPESTTKT